MVDMEQKHSAHKADKQEINPLFLLVHLNPPHLIGQPPILSSDNNLEIPLYTIKHEGATMTEKKEVHQNYKGFVAGVFSGIAKLSGGFPELPRTSTSLPNISRRLDNNIEWQIKRV